MQGVAKNHFIPIAPNLVVFMKTQEIKKEGEMLSLRFNDTSLDYKTYLKFL